MSNEPLWERSFPKCTMCGSEDKLSKVLYDALRGESTAMDGTLGAGFIPHSMMSPVEVIPLEKTQMVMPMKVLARFWDECADCGHVYVSRVTVGLGMSMPVQNPGQK